MIKFIFNFELLTNRTRLSVSGQHVAVRERQPESRAELSEPEPFGDDRRQRRQRRGGPTFG